METQITRSSGRAEQGTTRRITLRKALLACSVLASVLYVTTSILGAMRWEGYNPIDQTMSELFAVGAPSKSFVDPLMIAYSILWIALGVGVWLSAGSKLALRIAAAGLIGKEVEGLIVQIFFPMSMRGVEGPSHGPIHGVLTYLGVFCFITAMAAGSAAFGKRFRIYSLVTLLVSSGTAVIAGLTIPEMAADLPTPGMGVWERISIFSYLLWASVLAIGLLRGQAARAQDERARDEGRETAIIRRG